MRATDASFTRRCARAARGCVNGGGDYKISMPIDKPLLMMMGVMPVHLEKHHGDGRGRYGVTA